MYMCYRASEVRAGYPKLTLDVNYFLKRLVMQFAACHAHPAYRRLDAGLVRRGRSAVQVRPLKERDLLFHGRNALVTFQLHQWSSSPQKARVAHPRQDWDSDSIIDLIP